jgi:hypothetical protein
MTVFGNQMARKIKIQVQLESSSTPLQELQNLVLPLEVSGLQENSGNEKHNNEFSNA